MMIRVRTLVALAAVLLAVAMATSLLRSPAPASAQILAGDPTLADLAVGQPGGVTGSGKYAFFVLGRENSSHRWFCRFDSDAGTLAKLTDKGWTPINTAADVR